MVLSAMSSPKVFNLCEHRAEKNPKRRFLVGLVSALLGPLMPAIILANYIFYREQEYSLKRDLQVITNYTSNKFLISYLKMT